MTEIDRDEAAATLDEAAGEQGLSRPVVVPVPFKDCGGFSGDIERLLGTTSRDDVKGTLGEGVDG